ncbi:MAG: hypothetical protein IJU68_00065 [Bacteroidales bacterium]|nr:hypothetical protein [Bacteroidales bacterium]
MKRVFISIAFSCLALSAWAQDTYYAEMLSRNNYYGTARSTALGNAVTALGGDLGTIGINPAGSAVNAYSQITITPGLLFQTTNTGWSTDGSENFGPASATSHTKFNLPNGGFNLVFFTGRDYGVKQVSVGLVANNTNTFLNYGTGYGSNGMTSFLGNLAAAAGGVSPKDMGRDLYTAYCANQFGEYGAQGSNVYSGGNQMIDKQDRYCYVPGLLNQSAAYNTYGSKTDYIVNLGFNVSDNFYFGFNLGLPSTRYRREDIFSESAQNPVLFPVNFEDNDGRHLGTEGEPTTYYKSSYNSYKLNTDATGVYGKFGFIWLPTKSLRLGAAIQTPTRLTVNETWQYSAQTSYEDGRYNGSATSDRGEYSYRLRTPYVVNAGAAYTFGGFGLVSLDYELTDYSIMKYSDFNNSFFGSDDWAYTNEANRLFCGVSHSVRAGIEVKPLAQLSVRAGYSLVTDPEKYAADNFGNIVTAETWQGSGMQLSQFRYFKNNTHAFSFGLGYSSNGSFFADAAVRLTKYPTALYSPYYYGWYQALDEGGAPVDTGMPLERLDRKIVDVMLTIGWRF